MRDDADGGPREPALPIPPATEVVVALADALKEAKLTLATAESCTGGLIGALVTALPGSSDYYLGGVVAYANAVKVALLGVSPSTLAEHGAVSAEVAEAMARGARERLGADCAVSTTGVAGPGGGSAEKPVGLVYVGLATAAGVASRRLQLSGDRDAIRRAAATAALDWLRATIAPSRPY